MIRRPSCCLWCLNHLLRLLTIMRMVKLLDCLLIVTRAWSKARFPFIMLFVVDCSLTILWIRFPTLTMYHMYTLWNLDLSSFCLLQLFQGGLHVGVFGGYSYERELSIWFASIDKKNMWRFWRIHFLYIGSLLWENDFVPCYGYDVINIGNMCIP